MLSRRLDASQTLGLASAEQADAQIVVTRAFREACETELQSVYLYIRYRVGRDAADDLTAEVFLKALERIETFDPARGDAKTWLFGVAHNVVRDHFRAARRWKFLPIEWLNQRIATQPDPERHAIADEEFRHLAEALASLSGRERDVLGLKFGGGLTNRVIASLSGLSESNVAVIVYRALGKVRRQLERQGVRHA